MNGIIGMSSLVLGGVSSFCMVIAQAMPGVPHDLNTWPATAILGLVAMSCLCVTLFCVNKVFSTMTAHTEAIAQLVVHQAETNKRLDELCQKLGNRPCLKES